MKTNKIGVFILITLGFALALVTIEIFLRIYIKKTTLLWQDDKVLGKRLVPNQSGWFVSPTKEYFTWVGVNSQGWPDEEHSFEKPEDTFRILFLGDSFVENFQVPFEQRFFKKFEEKINTTSDINIEVIALGMGNTGTAQQLIALREFGLVYDPDLVIQMFLTANDVKNNSPALQDDPHMPYFKIENNKLILVSHKSKSERPLESVKKVLKNLRLIELILTTRQKALEENINKSAGVPIDYQIYSKHYDDKYKDAWTVTKKLILETKEITEEVGSEYILITLANNEQVNTEIWQEALATYPVMKSNNFNLEKPDKIITNFCEEKNINCLQMLPYFLEYTQANQNNPTHHRLDGHWNEIGTKLAAEFLINELKAISP